MDRYSTYSRPSYSATIGNNRSQRASSYKGSGLHDDMGSMSGSEDGSYTALHDIVKQEVEEQEHGTDQDLSLTSQTLNADGTPKRPMNAFMIFARKRRPQVSAQNQAMRTGEISKLLSKEWSSMPASEKQYYQEQAKLLKDSFNTKYPDYVYRRRPNNSKRRRRSDAAKPGDEGSGGELESPTDADGHLDADGESVYSRGSHEPPNFAEPPKYSAGPSISRSSTHPFQSNHPYYRNEPRLLYPPPSDRLRSGLHHRLSNPSMNYSLSSSSSYSTEMGSPQTWHSRLDRGPSSWSNQGRIPSSLKTGSYPAPSGPASWGSTLTSSSSSSGYSSSPSNLATLNTPFFPSQSSMSDYGADSSDGSPNFDSLALQPITSERASYPSRSDSLDNDPLNYPSSRNMSRVLPPVTSISGYPAPGPPATSPTISQHFWSRP